MLESFPFAVILGTVLGFLSGLGIGGGSLLMLWLTLVLGIDYPEARLINLLFFIPAAVIALYFRGRQGAVPWKAILPGMISGCVFAALFSILGRQLNTTILKKLFGGLLLITAFRELTWRKKK